MTRKNLTSKLPKNPKHAAALGSKLNALVTSWNKSKALHHVAREYGWRQVRGDSCILFEMTQDNARFHEDLDICVTLDVSDDNLGFTACIFADPSPDDNGWQLIRQETVHVDIFGPRNYKLLAERMAAGLLHFATELP